RAQGRGTRQEGRGARDEAGGQRGEGRGARYEGRGRGSSVPASVQQSIARNRTPHDFPSISRIEQPGLEFEQLSGMAESLICARSFEFGARILALCDKVWSRGPAARHVASELMRSGTSIGANAEEAQEGQSKADFIAKMCVSRKEARESGFWL